ncbi:MAG: protoporphyrinogen oxidase [candidate division Zixibacteria bacterium]|nr:protoporphyrinogen oxidase [candidate division Zixibacteria bacterium]
MPAVDVAIVGGGISGLAALHYLRRRRPEWTVVLLESDTRLGGTIGTDIAEGYSFDWGPNGFLDREPLTLALCDELGLRDRIERANNNVSNRFIARGGRLRPVPMSPPKFLASDILSIKGRLRVLMEPFAPGPADKSDESVYSFAERRIGKEAADYLVQPMVSGVYGGVAERLSLKSCFPVMHEMESEYGSLVKAMIARKRLARAKGKKSGGPAGPGGWLTSFHGGLYGIIERFGELYRDFVRTGSPVERIEKEDGLYRLRLRNSEPITARFVILALPSFAASPVVAPLSPGLATALSAIPYAPITVVCLGYDKRNVRRSLDGFGFLVPRREGLTILGSIWTSSIFARRAPEGKVQFRTMVGGDGDHGSVNLSDSALVDRVCRDMDSLLGLTGEPELLRIYRWSHGIPQYRIGHAEIVKQLEAELKWAGNLYVTGNAYYGIGLNDCVRQSHRVVEAILADSARVSS